jgi:hypothetical protein
MSIKSQRCDEAVANLGADYLFRRFGVPVTLLVAFETHTQSFHLHFATSKLRASLSARCFYAV